MLFRKPPIWSLQSGLVARPWRDHWRNAKAVFCFWEPGGGKVYPAPRFTPWSLNNGAIRKPTRYGPAVYFPGSSANEVESADGNPIAFASGEPYTTVILVFWPQGPSASSTEGIWRDGSNSTGSWLWAVTNGRLNGRHAGLNTPSSGSGPLISGAGWHALARTWDGQQVRQYIDGLRVSTFSTTLTGSFSFYRFGWQFDTSQAMTNAYVPFFGAFGVAWDDAMVARWSANPLGMLWPEMDAAFVAGDGGSPAAARRPTFVLMAG